MKTTENNSRQVKRSVRTANKYIKHLLLFNNKYHGIQLYVECKIVYSLRNNKPVYSNERRCSC